MAKYLNSYIKLTRISLKKKKSIDLKIIKEALEKLNKYRTHNCNELTKDNSGQKIALSGWINKKRDHGNLLFIDLRDNYGITQCIIDKSNENFKSLEKIQLESVIKINGMVVERSLETVNSELKTGEIEVNINSLKCLVHVRNFQCPYLVIKNMQKKLDLNIDF